VALLYFGNSMLMNMQQEILSTPLLPILVSRKTAAQLLSPPLRSVDEMLAYGVLPPRRVGRRVLIPREAWTRFAEVRI